MRCPHCKREGAYYRLRTNEIVCRNCGQISKGLNPSKTLIKKTKKMIDNKIRKIDV